MEKTPRGARPDRAETSTVTSPISCSSAIATPPGVGAIAVIRISGPQAFQISDLVFSSRKGKLANAPTHTAHFGVIRAGDQIIDEVIVPFFKENDYYGGINNGTNAIIKAVKGEYTAPAGYNKKSKGGRSIFFYIILGIIILVFSAGGRGGGGMFMSRRGRRGFGSAIFWGSMLGGGGSGGGGNSGGGFGGFGGGSSGGGGASGSW